MKKPEEKRALLGDLRIGKEVDLCVVVDDEPADDIWDSDALYEPFEAESKEDAETQGMSVWDDVIIEYPNHFVNGEDFDEDDLEEMPYWEKREAIVFDSYTIDRENNIIYWNDLNGNKHTVMFRAKERIIEEAV